MKINPRYDIFDLSWNIVPVEICTTIQATNQFPLSLYAEGTVLTADAELKRQDLLEKVLNESEWKGQDINSKIECMVVTKRKSTKCELRIREPKLETKLQQIQNLNIYLTN